MAAQAGNTAADYVTATFGPQYTVNDFVAAVRSAAGEAQAFTTAFSGMSPDNPKGGIAQAFGQASNQLNSSIAGGAESIEDAAEGSGNLVVAGDLLAGVSPQYMPVSAQATAAAARVMTTIGPQYSIADFNNAVNAAAGQASALASMVSAMPVEPRKM
jgi:hypothetical protein